MNLILSLLIIHYTGFFFLKKSKIISCGLFAWIGDKPEKFNYAKLHTLGVLNETRGKHSCGISFDGEIWNGVDDEKLYRDFSPSINDLLEEYPLENSVVIGHTRWATGGAHTIENAHPFGFGNNGKGSFTFIGAHNGSLLEYDKLAEKYNIDQYKGVGKNRNKKIDSEILLEIIYKHGPEVLNEYLGAAALLWYDIFEDNTMYVYHGKSKSYKSTFAATEERPLFYLKDKEGSLYISSIKESLITINTTGGEIDEFEHNKLYKIIDGDIDNAEYIEINRSNCYQKEYGSNSYSTYGKGYNYYSDIYDSNYINNSNNKSKKSQEIINLEEEKIRTTFEDINNKVFYSKLRYWKNNKLITGIFTPTKSNEMRYLAHDAKSAKEIYKNISSKDKFSEEPLLFYYFQGVALETLMDYNICIGRSKQFKAVDLSHMSKYPILDLTKKDSKIIKNGVNAKEYFLPLLSKYVYTVSEGKCVKKSLHENKFDEFKDSLLEIDKETLVTILEKDIFSNSSDSEELKLIREDLEGSIDECIAEVEEKLESPVLKKNSLNIFNGIKTYVTNKLEELWETEKLC